MRENKNKVYAFRDASFLQVDIEQCATVMDLKDSEFMRLAVRKLIKEVKDGKHRSNPL